jgi:Arc/MetJ-type ribon-helix-helix transcriptional regulator
VRLECHLDAIRTRIATLGPLAVLFYHFHLTEPTVRESKVTVKIPRPLYRKIQQVVDGSGFNSPTDFIVYVLRDLMGEADEKSEPDFSQEELDDVKRKLKNLGYL